ncbi:hypothetical protein H4R18_005024 [Coemansia javaensis]|uniref:Kinesin motor domain-containing protein n=1 Tax=Coemansia javaensis TaxID=2761396 RepID=A0A9W8LG80_9FUNG|nr:hypothetical protein H4R18_005024 [Coemansia javaensis]
MSVALRIRPLSAQEQAGGRTECVTQLPGVPQIVIGADRAFTFDHVFSPEVGQEQVYDEAIRPLVARFLQGYNATVLAYGYTGSGKTFSMGTGLSQPSVDIEAQGVVPRAIGEIWSHLEARARSQPGFAYSVDVSFLELYNEDLIDLLSLRGAAGPGGRGPAIREDSRGNMVLVGVERKEATDQHSILELLHQGALARTTASTEMNCTSSRSHAIFTIHLRQQGRGAGAQPAGDGGLAITSKMHFVDLAGSERIKRTGAEGDRAKEGISINAGLLALGNVISALGNPGASGQPQSHQQQQPQPQPQPQQQQQQAKRPVHVPYRDSKLTRLLQDSLGGNSQTLMLACISPSDDNSHESLNTLRYANRARNIRNRVAVNFDKNSSAELTMLKTEVARLRGELSKLKLQRRQQLPAGAAADDGGDSARLAAEVARLQSQSAELGRQLYAARRRATLLEHERDTLRVRVAGLGGSAHSTPSMPPGALPPEDDACGGGGGDPPLTTRPSSLFADGDVLSRSNVLETIDQELSEQAKRHEHQIDGVRRHYESKLELAHEALAIMQKERDIALQRLAHDAGARGAASPPHVTPTKLRLPSRAAPAHSRKASGASRPGSSSPDGSPARDGAAQLRRLQSEVARLRAANRALGEGARAEAEQLALQVQEQAKEISRLRRQNTGRRESYRYSLLSFRENSWGVAKGANSPGSGDSGPRLLRAAFIKAVLEGELQRCVRARQLLRERDAYLNRQDRLMNEQNDQLLRMQGLDLDGDDAHGAAEMAKANERIEIIDAELQYLDLKVRDAEAEVAQLVEATAEDGGDLGSSGLKMTPVITNLSGLAMRMVEDVVRIDHRAFADFFDGLPPSDATGLAYLLMQDIIEHRLVSLRDEHDRARLEEELMESRRTLLAMQKTAINAALSYERELGDAERKLSMERSNDHTLLADSPPAGDPPASGADNSLDSDRSVYRSVRERGILLRSALLSALAPDVGASAEPGSPDPDADGIPLSTWGSSRSLYSFGGPAAAVNDDDEDMQLFPRELYARMAVDVDDDTDQQTPGPALAFAEDEGEGEVGVEEGDGYEVGIEGYEHGDEVDVDVDVDDRVEGGDDEPLEPAAGSDSLQSVRRLLPHDRGYDSDSVAISVAAAAAAAVEPDSGISDGTDTDEYGRDAFFSDPEGEKLSEGSLSDGEIPELYRSGSGEIFRLPNLARKSSARSRRRYLVRRMTLRRKLAQAAEAAAAAAAASPGGARRAARRRGSVRRKHISRPIVPREMLDYVDRCNPGAIRVGGALPLLASPDLLHRMHAPAADKYQANVTAIALHTNWPLAMSEPPGALREAQSTESDLAVTAIDAGSNDRGLPCTPRSAGRVSLDFGANAAVLPPPVDTSAAPALGSPVGSAATAASPPAPAWTSRKPLSPATFGHQPALSDERVACHALDSGTYGAPALPGVRRLSPTERANASLFSMLDAGRAISDRPVTVAFPPSSPARFSLEPSSGLLPLDDPAKAERAPGLVAKPSRIRRRAQSTFVVHQAGSPEALRKQRSGEAAKPSGNRLSRLLSGIGLGGSGSGSKSKQLVSPLAPVAMASSFDVHRSSIDSSYDAALHLRKMHSTIDGDGAGPRFAI